MVCLLFEMWQMMSFSKACSLPTQCPKHGIRGVCLGIRSLVVSTPPCDADLLTRHHDWGMGDPSLPCEGLAWPRKKKESQVKNKQKRRKHDASMWNTYIFTAPFTASKTGITGARWFSVKKKSVSMCAGDNQASYFQLTTASSKEEPLACELRSILKSSLGCKLGVDFGQCLYRAYCILEVTVKRDPRQRVCLHAPDGLRVTAEGAWDPQLR